LSRKKGYKCGPGGEVGSLYSEVRVEFRLVSQRYTGGQGKIIGRIFQFPLAESIKALSSSLESNREEKSSVRIKEAQTMEKSFGKERDSA